MVADDLAAVALPLRNEGLVLPADLARRATVQLLR